MQVFLNILKFTLGLPILIIASVCWLIVSLFYTFLVLPLSTVSENAEYYKNQLKNLKFIWSKLK